MAISKVYGAKETLKSEPLLKKISSLYKFDITNGYETYTIPKATLDALTPSGYTRIMTLATGGKSSTFCIGAGGEQPEGYKFNIVSGYSSLSNWSVEFYIICMKDEQ